MDRFASAQAPKLTSVKLFWSRILPGRLLLWPYMRECYASGQISNIAPIRGATLAPDTMRGMPGRPVDIWKMSPKLLRCTAIPIEHNHRKLQHNMCMVWPDTRAILLPFYNTWSLPAAGSYIFVHTRIIQLLTHIVRISYRTLCPYDVFFLNS